MIRKIRDHGEAAVGVLVILLCLAAVVVEVLTMGRG